MHVLIMTIFCDLNCLNGLRQHDHYSSNTQQQKKNNPDQIKSQFQTHGSVAMHCMHKILASQAKKKKSPVAGPERSLHASLEIL